MRLAKLGALLVALVLGAAGVASAATTEILLVYNGQTEINRETYKYLQRGLYENGVTATLRAGTATTAVTPGAYKAIIVLNTGITSGIDPALKTFMDKYTAKKDVYLVTLLKGATATTITKIAASVASGGVDGVAAASYWAKGRGDMSANAFHDDWLALLVAFLKTK